MVRLYRSKNTHYFLLNSNIHASTKCYRNSSRLSKFDILMTHNDVTQIPLKPFNMTIDRPGFIETDTVAIVAALFQVSLYGL